MTEYITEQEKIEFLKNWLKEYSLVIILGIAIALACVSGYHYVQNRHINKLSHASAIYDEMLAARDNADLVDTQANKLIKHYSNTVYSQVAALTLARTAIAKNDFGTAKKQLNNVIEQSNVSSFRQIARLRLAKILINDKDPDAAISLLNKVDDKSFIGYINEVSGDAFAQKNDKVKARLAYHEALAGIPNADIARPVLQMKYDNLAPNE